MQSVDRSAQEKFDQAARRDPPSPPLEPPPRPYRQQD